MQTKETNCPCGSLKKYNNCCALIHNNIFEAKTAEQLMRSRYTAFVIANGTFLQKSHASKTRPNTREQKDLLHWTKSVDWIKLEILKSTKDTVEFKAFFQLNGKLDVIHEKSQFIIENGYWVYFGIV